MKKILKKNVLYKKRIYCSNILDLFQIHVEKLFVYVSFHIMYSN